MFRLRKLILPTLSIFMITALTACNMGQVAAPTATALDINAITTNVAATVQAQLTINAPTIAPSATITNTPAITDTPTGAVATNTQGIVPIEETSSITVTITPTLQFGFTATPSVTPIGGIIPSLTPILAANNTPSGPVCKNSAFDGDITIPDGTTMAPWEKFEKVWGIKNTGTCRWDEGFYFASTDGPPSMAKSQSYQGKNKFATSDRFVEAGQTIAMSIEMYAPGDAGEYVAHWHLFDDRGQAFGQDFTVVIKVVK